MKVIHLIAATAALAMSTLGFAQESRPATGIYVGLEGGSVSYAVNDGNDGPSRDEYVESARAGAARLSVGYQFTPNFPWNRDISIWVISSEKNATLAPIAGI
ncbi:hypothetical protein [Herbaspirillum huttiense]|uniref:Porin family protein n=2 Tax=Herbaspirillum huttiense TaxID=863372 RepID=A0AAJ2H6M0_9BURK|nr:hypothetical protein [Herbaspirillum huttiense]MDR9834806.1 hypothetical protein [Herbaspirillum huttiense]